MTLPVWTSEHSPWSLRATDYHRPALPHIAGSLRGSCRPTGRAFAVREHSRGADLCRPMAPRRRRSGALFCA